MSKVEMFQKMLADQKIIRKALQNGIPLKELEKTQALNLQPYQIRKIDDQAYEFNTEKGIGYLCSFLSYAEYFTKRPYIASCFSLSTWN